MAARLCEGCKVAHGGDVTCIEAMFMELRRLRNKVADLRGECERLRRERDRALGKLPPSRREVDRGA